MWHFVIGFASGGALVSLSFLLYYSLWGRRKAKETQRRTAGLVHAGRLAGGLAHEIKNPLSTINLNLQLLREDFAHAKSLKEERVARRVEVLEKEVVRLQETLNDFLRFARREPPDRKPHDLNRMVEEVLDFVAPQAAKHHITVHRSLSPGLKPCMVDANLLKQALLNLVLNAHQAMPDGGEFMVRSTPLKKGVGIEMIDTGPGIQPEELDKVFEAYYSTKAGGTGLGLATTKQIIEDHGGSISVQSDPGRGTRFLVEIPYV
jgi:signal transduction histidine kinase